jgi:hypothetical protein
VRDYLKDEVHFTDQSVESGTLLRIDASTVVTDRRTAPRGHVTWIYLASPQGGGGAAPPQASGGGARAPDTPAYVWEGRIQVENRFRGRTLAVDVHGRHAWQAAYDVQFGEVPGGAAESDASGRSLSVHAFVPLVLKYTILADHHHDYDHRWGDVVMLGQAMGSVTGGALKDALRGRLARLEGAVAAPEDPPSSFGSWKDFSAFIGRPARAGCYQLSVSFPGTPRERRARYQGITRSGSSPIHPDPDQDFLRVMPGYMPEGTLVLGCLERPDQTQAHGAYSFPGTDPSPWPEVPQITIKWSFTRRRP